MTTLSLCPGFFGKARTAASDTGVVSGAAVAVAPRRGSDAARRRSVRAGFRSRARRGLRRCRFGAANPAGPVRAGVPGQAKGMVTRVGSASGEVTVTRFPIVLSLP